MKVAMIFIGLLVTSATAEGEKNSPYNAAIVRGLYECYESMKPSNETVQLMEDEKGNNNRDVQCYIACIMEKAGIRNGLSVDVEKIESLLRAVENPNEERIQFVVEQSKACKAEAEVSNDECEVMGHYMNCFNKKMTT